MIGRLAAIDGRDQLYLILPLHDHNRQLISVPEASLVVDCSHIWSLLPMPIDQVHSQFVLYHDLPVSSIPSHCLSLRLNIIDSYDFEWDDDGFGDACLRWAKFFDEGVPSTVTNLRLQTIMMTAAMPEQAMAALARLVARLPGLTLFVLSNSTIHGLDAVLPVATRAMTMHAESPWHGAHYHRIPLSPMLETLTMGGEYGWLNEHHLTDVLARLPPSLTCLDFYDVALGGKSAVVAMLARRMPPRLVTLRLAGDAA
ncbi:hypothetical protein GGF32_004569 [Allomyces javanicus]|nr:hypothetical protein GGF32_004569 [Allomyces javanicus]